MKVGMEYIEKKKKPISHTQHLRTKELIKSPQTNSKIDYTFKSKLG